MKDHSERHHKIQPLELYCKCCKHMPITIGFIVSFNSCLYVSLILTLGLFDEREIDTDSIVVLVLVVQTWQGFREMEMQPNHFTIQ